MDIKAWLRNTASAQQHRHERRSPPVRPDEVDFAHHPCKRKKTIPASSSATLSPCRNAEDGRSGRSQRYEEAAAHHPSVVSSPARMTEECDSGANLRDERFERRKRHKTRPEIFEPFSGSRKRRSRKREREPLELQAKIKDKTGRGKRAAKLRNDPIQNFQAKNIGENRLTLKQPPAAGLFNRGRASSSQITRGLPDLVFSKMRFLSNPVADQSKGTGKDRDTEAQRDPKWRTRVRSEDTSAFFFSQETEVQGGNHGTADGEITSKPEISAGLNDPNSLDKHPTTDTSRASVQRSLQTVKAFEKRPHSAEIRASLFWSNSDRPERQSAVEQALDRQGFFPSFADIEVGQLGVGLPQEKDLGAMFQGGMSTSGTGQSKYATAKATCQAPIEAERQAKAVERPLDTGDHTANFEETRSGKGALSPEPIPAESYDPHASISQLLLVCNDALESGHGQTGAIKNIQATPKDRHALHPAHLEAVTWYEDPRVDTGVVSGGLWVTERHVGHAERLAQEEDRLRDEHEHDTLRARCAESRARVSYLHWQEELRTVESYLEPGHVSPWGYCGSRPTYSRTRSYDEEMYSEGAAAYTPRSMWGREGLSEEDTGHLCYEDEDEGFEKEEEMEDVTPTDFWRPNRLY